MISCRFLVPNEILTTVDNFIENLGLTNFSSFENSDLGFLDKPDENGLPVAKFFNVEIFVVDRSDAKSLESNLRNRFQNEIRNLETLELKDGDWIGLYTKELKPVLCEDFYFYNEQIQTRPDDEKLIPIKLNSALAFGSGHHQTTQSCLSNMRCLNNKGFYPKNILDMGCGTGILGICALKIWHDAKLLGIDIDPEAARVARENYLANSINSKVVTASDVSFVNAKVDLILCNILKQTLIDLCNSFYCIANTTGYIITSGFITNQEYDIVACYQNRGFEIINRINLEDWLSILFRKK
jgi:ribosomal protein L11 methyltransferase